MTAIVSLLRGINVGGHKKIRMEALRDLYKSLGLANPSTHIQSGNVIFGAKEKDMARLAARIGNAIEQKLGVRSEIILRSASDLRGVVAKNPFAGRPEIPPNKLHVTFLASDPGPEARENVSKLPAAPDEFHLVGRELYTYFPNGFSGSKLPPSLIDKALLKVPGTARNWNTVTKLLELAENWSDP